MNTADTTAFKARTLMVELQLYGWRCDPETAAIWRGGIRVPYSVVFDAVASFCSAICFTLIRDLHTQADVALLQKRASKGVN
jgi:hypothetical protein